jgi:hypothetical protein
MKTGRLLSFLLILSFLSLIFAFPAPTVKAQSAELSIYPTANLPLVQPNQETNIPLQFIDTFGINWTKLQNLKQYGLIGRLSPLQGRILSFITVRIIWPIIHRAWRPFLGYCTISLSASLVDNSTGWTVGIDPSTIAQSTDGRKETLNLKVLVNDLTSDSTAIVRVTADRILTDGSVYGTSTFDLPLRSSRLNSLQVTPDSPIKEAAPSSIVPFTINVKNQGFFIDSFGITVTSPDITATVSDQSIVLNPGQSTDVTLWVMTPSVFYDPGTSHAINISVYSLNNAGQPFYGGVQVRTSGFYVSGLIFTGLGGAALLVVLFLFFFFVVFERRAQEVYGKPAKPWKLPEEQLSLMDLKQNNPEAYEKERTMMVQEYRSALDYYKDTRRTARFQPKEPKAPRKPLFAPLTQRLPSLKRDKKKPKAKAKPKNKEAAAPTTTTTSVVDTEREKALQRVQKEQAKQQRRKK